MEYRGGRRPRRRATARAYLGGMYIPEHFAVDDDTVRELLDNHGAADLITSTPQGLVATLLPFIFDRGAGDHGSLLGHVARNNDQWRLPTQGEAMVIVRGPDAYISPAWYATKAEHGRVVPTWNYVTAHVYGELVIHDNVEWLDTLVRRLTERHEARTDTRWSVDDAPAKFIAGQLRAIVGLEVRITRIEAKAKLSQNRSDADMAEVVDGLRSVGDTASAAAVVEVSPPREL